MKQIKIFTNDHTKIKTSAKNEDMTIAEVVNRLLSKRASLTVPIAEQERKGDSQPPLDGKRASLTVPIAEQERKGDSQPPLDGKPITVNGNLQKKKEVSGMEKIDKNELGALIDEALREKEAKNQEKRDFEGLRTKIDSLEKKFCAGDVCFLTKDELNTYLAKHSKSVADQVDNSLKELKATLDKAGQAEEAKKEIEAKAKKPVLSKMDERIRAGMTEEELRERDAKVSKAMDQQNITFVDAFRVLKNSEKDYKAVRRHAFEDASKDELLELYESCSLRGDCEEIYSELKKRGLNVQGRGEDGEWADLSKEPEKKREYF